MSDVDGRPIYIHHENEFISQQPNGNMVIEWVEPYGGLWENKKGDPFGEKRWSEWEEFCLNRLNASFEFVLKSDAKILTLDHVEQLFDLPHRSIINDVCTDYVKKLDYRNNYRLCHLDFEKIQREYDALEMIFDKDYRLKKVLDGWDCNCIVIMNPGIVEVIERK